MKRLSTWLIAGVFFLGCGPGAPAPSESPAPESPTTPPSPEPSPAEAPPAAASPLPLPAGATGALRLTSGPGGVVLSWIVDGDGRGLRAARWTEAGWGPELDVTRRPGLLGTWADPPRVVAGTGQLVATWLEGVGEGHATHLFVSRSVDGREWTLPLEVHDDETHTEHGFATVLPLADGSTELLWLDGRGYAADRKETSLLRRTLGADGALSPEVTVDPRTCDCCPTAGLVLASGDPLVVWRDRIGGEVRDLSAARLGTGSEPERIHEDGWEFAGCPVNGPGLASLGGGAVASWYTEAGGPRVRVARTTDGSSWSGVEDLAAGDGVLGRTAALALDDRVVVIWVEKVGDAAKLMGRSVTADSLGSPRELGETEASRSAGFPSMARFGEQVLIVSAGRGLLVSPPSL